MRFSNCLRNVGVFFVFILMAALVYSLAGCSGRDGSSGSKPAAGAVAPSTTQVRTKVALSYKMAKTGMGKTVVMPAESTLRTAVVKLRLPDGTELVMAYAGNGEYVCNVTNMDEGAPGYIEARIDNLVVKNFFDSILNDNGTVDAGITNPDSTLVTDLLLSFAKKQQNLPQDTDLPVSELLAGFENATLSIDVQSLRTEVESGVVPAYELARQTYNAVLTLDNTTQDSAALLAVDPTVTNLVTAIDNGGIAPPTLGTSEEQIKAVAQGFLNQLFNVRSVQALGAFISDTGFLWSGDHKNDFLLNASSKYSSDPIFRNLSGAEFTGMNYTVAEVEDFAGLGREMYLLKLFGNYTLNYQSGVSITRNFTGGDTGIYVTKDNGNWVLLGDQKRMWFEPSIGYFTSPDSGKFTEINVELGNRGNYPPVSVVLSCPTLFTEGDISLSPTEEGGAEFNFFLQGSTTSFWSYTNGQNSFSTGAPYLDLEGKALLLTVTYADDSSETYEKVVHLKEPSTVVTDFTQNDDGSITLNWRPPLVDKPLQRVEIHLRGLTYTLAPELRTFTVSYADLQSVGLTLNDLDFFDVIYFTASSQYAFRQNFQYEGNKTLAATPVFTPPAGRYETEQQVTITSATPGATILYTLDGSDPLVSGSQAPSGVTVLISGSTTIRAIARVPDRLDSLPASAFYNFQVAEPTFSPVSGTHFTDCVTGFSLATTTPGAVVSYSTDGGQNWQLFSQGAQVCASADITVRAFASNDVIADSAVVTATYIYDAPQTVAAPVFSPQPGTYSNPMDVTITSPTPDTVILYTLDGSTPAVDSPTTFLYTFKTHISTSQTIKAIAIKANWLDSPVSSGMYVINAGVLSPQNLLVRYTFDGDVQDYSGNGNHGSRVGAAFVPSRLGQGLSFMNPEGASTTTDFVGMPYPASFQALNDGSLTVSVTFSSTDTVGQNGKLLGNGSSFILNYNSAALPHAHASVLGAPLGDTLPLPARAYATDSLWHVQTLVIDRSQAPQVKVSEYVDGNLVASNLYSSLNPLNLHDLVIGAAALTDTRGARNTVIDEFRLYDRALTAAENAQLAQEMAGIPELTQPSFLPNGGSFASAQLVSISNFPPEASVYYTVDGSEPTVQSAFLYQAGQEINVSSTSTLKAIAVRPGWVDSAVATASFTINGQLGAPSIAPNGGTYAGSQNVTITGPAGSTIYYTLDGSDPFTATGSLLSAVSPVSFQLSVGQTTVRAYAGMASFLDSAEASASFTVNGQTSLPVIAPNGGVFAGGQTVTVTGAPGSTIYYTVNGSDPKTATAGTGLLSAVSPASVAIGVGNTTVRTFSRIPGWLDSSEASASFTVNGQLAAPVIAPNGGTFAGNQSVTITGPAGSTILYTLDGSDPLTATGSLITGLSPVSFQLGTGIIQVRAFARQTNWLDSNQAGASFTINGELAQPVIAPNGGTYADNQNITITGPAGSTIYYTVNGTDPRGATVQTGLLTGLSPVGTSVGTGTTLVQAYAGMANWLNSPVSSASFTVNGALAAPLISPNGGTFTSVQTVTVTGAVGSTIHYTLNGLDPFTATAQTGLVSASSPAVFQAGGGTTPVKAYQTMTNWLPSPAATADFTVNLPPEPTLSIASVNSFGVSGNELSYAGAISADGRFVQFSSYATNLVPFTDGILFQAFLHDNMTGETILISKDSFGNPGNGYSESHSVSGDGRFAAFESTSTNLVPDDFNTQNDVFVFDRISGSVSLASVGLGQVSSNGYSHSPVLSSNGQALAFASLASNLVNGDLNGESDIFLVTTANPTTSERVSLAFDGAEPNGASPSSFTGAIEAPSISSDGRFVAFSSDATNLISTPNPNTGVYVRDRTLNTTFTASVNPSGQLANSMAISPSISADGRYVAFASTASNLDPNTPSDGSWQIYVRDTIGNTTTLVSKSPASAFGDANSWGPSISPDGKKVVFTSIASNLTGTAYDGNYNVFLYDFDTDTTKLLSSGTAGTSSENTNSAISGGYGVTFREDMNPLSPTLDQVYLMALPYGVNQVAAPVFDPLPGVYTAAHLLSLTSDTPGAEIRYTLDGSTPTPASSLYVNGITISANVQVRAIAIKSGMQDSPVENANYTITGQLAAPSIEPNGGEFAGSQLVTITGAPGSTILYTLNGVDPRTIGDVQIFSGVSPVTVNLGLGTTTLKALARQHLWLDSPTSTAIFTVNGQLAAPVFASTGGANFSDYQLVSFEPHLQGATILYTLDGSAPTQQNGTVYTGTPFSLDRTTTVKAIAVKANWQDSAEASQTYTGVVSTPFFQDTGLGAVDSGTMITIQNFTPNSTIHYTLDAAAPTPVWFTAPSGVQVLITESVTITAYATRDGMTQSPTNARGYLVRTATPVISPITGTLFGSCVNVSFAAPAPGVTIRYTTDGSTPNAGSAIYGGTPFQACGTSDISLSAYASNGNPAQDSYLASAVYVYVPPEELLAPIITAPTSEAFINSLDVTLTPGQTGTGGLIYTLDGSTPDFGVGTTLDYEGPFTIIDTALVKARAWKIDTYGRMVQSNVATAFYSIAFADPNLDAAVRTSLGLPLGAVLSRQLFSTVTVLDVNSSHIADLTGLNYFSNLVDLNIAFNQIVDLSQVGTLSNLTILRAEKNQITTLAPLSGLTHLNTLNVSFNRLTDSGIAALSLIPTIQTADLRFNCLTSTANIATTGQVFAIPQDQSCSGLVDSMPVVFADPVLDEAVRTALSIAPETPLTYGLVKNLDVLDSTSVPIDSSVSNLSGIEWLTGLHTLDLSYNSIFDVTPLAGLSNLAYLDLSGNTVDDITPIAGLPLLSSLFLDFNDISDLTPLSNATNLTSLTMDANSISDLSPLTALINLAYLSLGSNLISDVSPLAQLPSLVELHITDNCIADATPLDSFTQSGGILFIAPQLATCNRAVMGSVNVNLLTPSFTIEAISAKGDKLYAQPNGDGIWSLSLPPNNNYVLNARPDGAPKTNTAKLLQSGINPLVGSWVGYPGNGVKIVITFLDGKNYILSQDGDPAAGVGTSGNGGLPGIERGVYTWNQQSGLFTATPIVDTNGGWGFSNPLGAMSITTNGNTLTLNVVGFASYTAARVVPQPNTLVGAYGEMGAKPVAITFIDETTYVLSIDESTANAQPGMETGTYSWNSSTNLFTSVEVLDTNGEAGFSNMQNTSVYVKDGTITFLEGPASLPSAPITFELGRMPFRVNRNTPDLLDLTLIGFNSDLTTGFVENTYVHQDLDVIASEKLRDTDGDFLPDLYDEDIDGDGTPNFADLFAFSKFGSATPDYIIPNDADFDQVPDSLDEYPSDAAQNSRVLRKAYFYADDMVRRIENGALTLAVRSIGVGESNSLNYIQPNLVRSMASDVTVTNGYVMGATGRARVLAGAFNDGTLPPAAAPMPGSTWDQTGEVYASSELRLSENGLAAIYYVLRCENYNCSDITTYTLGSFGSVNFGTTYRLMVDYNPASEVFTFGFGPQGQITQTAQWNSTGRFPSKTASLNPTRSVGTRISGLIDQKEEGYLKADFDNITITNLDSSTVSETFSTPLIDSGIWGTREQANQVEETAAASGQHWLVSELSYFGGEPTSNALFANPATITKTLQADVTLLDWSMTGAAIPRARLGGYWYNDGSTGDGLGGMNGDVVANVEIRDTGTGPRGYCTVAVATKAFPVFTADYNGIGAFVTASTIPLDTPVTMKINWNEDGLGNQQFTCTVGTESLTLAAPPVAGPPVNSGRFMGTKIAGSAGTAHIKAAFDNVLVNDINPPGFEVYENFEY